MTAHKMEYRIGPITTFPTKEAIETSGMVKKANELDGVWVKINPENFAFVEDTRTTVVYVGGDNIGCACGKAVSGALCEHLLKLRDAPTVQLSVKSRDYEWLSSYLMSAEGWVVRDRELYPPDVQDPEEQEHVDPPDVPEDAAEETTAAPEETRVVSRKCTYCGHVVTGEDVNEVKRLIAEHRETCEKNPNRNQEEAPKRSKPVTEPVKQETPKPAQPKSTKPTETAKPGSVFGWLDELVEHGVCQLFGDTGTGKTAFCREAAIQAADEGKKVVYWDSEGNMTRSQRAEMAEHHNITYILDRDWSHIKNMMLHDLSKGSPKLQKCDLFILDSIGIPVLGVYGMLKQNQKGNALLEMQGLMYQLTVWADKNEAVCLVTNQPVSEMNKTEEEKKNRHPFGDKAKYFTKEIMRAVMALQTDYKTECHIIAWRSRSAGRGKMLGKVVISDSGVEITPEPR